ncbi:MAG: YqeG family HAD IIIA-type phosphatase [Clostridia bacterium]|nr:YqeG family HAD IIIA-type phosphatase [Clostridia bacterium]
MALFKPYYFINSLSDLSAEVVNRNNIKLIILDIDDTLVRRKDENIDNRTLSWIKTMQENNLKLFLVSNNFCKRVKNFSTQTGLPFVCLSGKPLPFGFIYALIKTHTKRKNTLIIGDQIFTDVLGANLIGIKSVLVEPKSTSKKIFMRFKRLLESLIKSKLLKNKF